MCCCCSLRKGYQVIVYVLLLQFEKGVLKDLSVTGDGLVVKETVRMLGQVVAHLISKQIKPT